MNWSQCMRTSRLCRTHSLKEKMHDQFVHSDSLSIVHLTIWFLTSTMSCSMVHLWIFQNLPSCIFHGFNFICLIRWSAFCRTVAQVIATVTTPRLLRSSWRQAQVTRIAILLKMVIALAVKSTKLTQQTVKAILNKGQRQKRKGFIWSLSIGLFWRAKRSVQEGRKGFIWSLSIGLFWRAKRSVQEGAGFPLARYRSHALGHGQDKHAGAWCVRDSSLRRLEKYEDKRTWRDGRRKMRGSRHDWHFSNGQHFSCLSWIPGMNGTAVATRMQPHVFEKMWKCAWFCWLVIAFYENEDHAWVGQGLIGSLV